VTNSHGIEVGKSTLLVMVSWPRLIVQRVPSAADGQSWNRFKTLGIHVRAGVHTGECEVMGEKLGGIAVHIGARIGALAAPDEVLVSRTVSDLVAGSGLRFEDRGTHSLKGVPGSWQLLAAA